VQLIILAVRKVAYNTHMTENGNNEFKFVRSSVTEAVARDFSDETDDELIVIGATSKTGSESVAGLPVGDSEAFSENNNQAREEENQSKPAVDLDDLRQPMPFAQRMVVLFAVVGVIILAVYLITH